jgi:molecular chaperone DnaK
MVREAEQHAAEDKRRRELIEARNQADATIYEARRQLGEQTGRIDDRARRSVEEAIETLQAAATREDTGPIRQRTEALARSLMHLGESANASAPGPEAGAASGADNIVDAEFEDADDNKRRTS